MKTPIHSTSWLSPSKLFLFIVLLSFSSVSQAEYYLVTSSVDYGVPCVKKYYKKHKVHKVYHKKHKRYRPCRSTCSIKVYCPAVVTPCSPPPVVSTRNGCGSCGAWRSGYYDESYSGVYFAQPEYYRDYGNTYTTSYESYSYNPDMSTGDDDSSINPNLDIDRY